MTKPAFKSTFITWYPTCRRSDTIAAAFGGSSQLIHYFKFKQPLYAPAKYLLQTLKSTQLLIRERPDVVFVASPPTVAALVVWMFAAITGREYVIDAHTGLFDDRRWTWLGPVNRFLSRRALATIITNAHLERTVESWGGRAIVIGDVPVDFDNPSPVDLGPGKHVVVVNTFSVDEPLDNIVAAAKRLPAVTFHITGNIAHSRNTYRESLPNNARFTGWLSEEGYASLLSSCDAVMCLTTHDHTMQRGAYEAMALARPLITSDWRILRDTFSEGTVHVDNSTESIESAVRAVIERQDALSLAMSGLAQSRREVFDSRIKELVQEIAKEIQKS